MYIWNVLERYFLTLFKHDILTRIYDMFQMYFMGTLDTDSYKDCVTLLLKWQVYEYFFFGLYLHLTFIDIVSAK